MTPTVLRLTMMVTMTMTLFVTVVTVMMMFLYDDNVHPLDNQEAQCATLNCSFNCKLTPQGPKCFCAPGQVPVNVTQCMDFDECSIEGMCDRSDHSSALT